MSRKKRRKPATDGESLTHRSFGALDGLSELPAGSEESSSEMPKITSKRGQKNTKRGRVDIVRQTAHRGGKAVTVVRNFTGIGLPEKQDLFGEQLHQFHVIFNSFAHPFSDLWLKQT